MKDCLRLLTDRFFFQSNSFIDALASVYKLTVARIGVNSIPVKLIMKVLFLVCAVLLLLSFVNKSNGQKGKGPKVTHKVSQFLHSS